MKHRCNGWLGGRRASGVSGEAHQGTGWLAVLLIVASFLPLAVQGRPVISNLDGDSITFAEDGPAVATVSLAVAATEDLPVVTTAAGMAAFVEGNNEPSLSEVVDPAITVPDADDPVQPGVTVSISTNFTMAEDSLSFTNDGVTKGNIAATYDSDAGELVLTSAGNTGTMARRQAALPAVVYVNASETPDPAPRTVTFVAHDGLQGSAPATRTIEVTSVNDSPRPGELDLDTVTFTEAIAAALLENAINATVLDADSSAFPDGLLAVRNSANGQPGGDVLGILPDAHRLCVVTVRAVDDGGNDGDGDDASDAQAFHVVITPTGDAPVVRAGRRTTSSNTDSITILAAGPAAPSPSFIEVLGEFELIQSTAVAFHDIVQGQNHDVQLLLTSPYDATVWLVGDEGDSGPLSAGPLRFADDHDPLPFSASFSTRTIAPSGYHDSWLRHAGDPPYGSRLSVLTSAAPNGLWRLYASDDSTGDVGEIQHAWSLSFLTTGGAPDAVMNAPYTFDNPTGFDVELTDADTNALAAPLLSAATNGVANVNPDGSRHECLRMDQRRRARGRRKPQRRAEQPVQSRRGQPREVAGNELHGADLHGRFKGTLRDNGTGKPTALNGVIHPGPGFGAGYFLGTNQSGSIVIGEP